MEIINTLLDAALKARKNSYCPYSGFAVGAAVMDDKGNIYSGCNVENAAYGDSVCAERVAMFEAVSEGASNLKYILVAGSPKGDAITDYAYPCGTCRQVMSELMDGDAVIYVAGPEGDIKEYTLEELLPHSFTLKE